MRVIDIERETYEAAWEIPMYSAKGSSPGESYIEIFKEFATPGATVLDAGCGSGQASLALQDAGYHVAGCDLVAGKMPYPAPFPFAVTPLWASLRPVAQLAHTAQPTIFTETTFDWVFCCDVLEHLPPQFTMLAIEQLLQVATQGVFLTVCTQPDNGGFWVGKPLHQTVQHFSWWRDSLRELGTVIDARDIIVHAVFVLQRGI